MSYWMKYSSDLCESDEWRSRHTRSTMGKYLEAYVYSCPQGGIHGKISLTAYVVAALLETGITTEVSSHTKYHSAISHSHSSECLVWRP